MATFNYHARQGGKAVSGNIEAADKSMAAVLLRKQGAVPLRIERAEIRRPHQIAQPRRTVSLLGGKSIKSKEITNFTRQLATLLTSGLPLVKSLQMLASQTPNPALREVIVSIGQRLHAGATFSETISEHPRHFNALYLSMVRAGEAGGILDTAFERLAQMREAREELTSKVHGAMIYPVFMFLAMTGCVGVLVGFVVPRFTRLFADMGQALPLPTLILMHCADVVKNGWWIAILVVFAAWLALRQYTSSEQGRMRVDILKLKTPALGNLLLTVSMARVCRTVGTLLQSGVPLLAALRAASGVTGNSAIEGAIDAVRLEVQEGKTMGDAMSRVGYFPKYVSEMAAIGEESGSLGEMLEKVAQNYEYRIDQLVKSLTALVEPVMILVMGGLVAFIVMAMLFPIFQMNLMAG